MVSLGLVILAIALPPLVGASFEYLASFGFITALAIIRAGIWKATPQWPWEAARESLKWILGLTGIATLSGILGVYSHEIVDFIKAIVTTIFTGISLLFVLSLLYGVNKHQLRYRSVRIRRAGNYRRRRFR
ncbi:MAG: hypothetical protein ACREN8_01455 [Candidatus Dormibacteraceae bacterium]